MDMKYVVIIFVTFLWSCEKDNDKVIEVESVNLTKAVSYKTIEGIEPNLLSLDIYYNNLVDEKKPVVIWVHGGGWSIGDKINQIENKVSLFQSLEYIVISVNYRLSPFPYEVNNTDRIMYPIHNNDVADAIKWVFDNVSQYGGNQNKIVLLGHSAGAHLVALTGTDNSFLENVGLNLTNIKGIGVIEDQS